MGLIRNALVSSEKLELARQLRRDATAAETLAWNQLRDRRCLGLKFRRQQVVRGLIVDLYCAERRLAVELDGGIHADRVDYDRARDEVLAREGILVLRVPNEKVDQLESLVAACLAGKTSPPTPSP